MMEYRKLSREEIQPDLLMHLRRYQEITDCWCKEAGVWCVRPMPRVIGDWNQEQREFICFCLGNILSEGGMVAGAFLDGALKGIVAVEGASIGSRNQYLPVAFLHVSQELRGHGIGQSLFSMAKAFAGEKGAEKLYISSQPSVQTQAFYKAMGCVEAEEYHAAYVEHNPHECQIECKL